MNKRYKEQIEEFIYRGQKTPFSIGTIVVCFLCLLFLIVATFTQINVTHIWPVYDNAGNLVFENVTHPYVAQIPVVIFIAALLGPGYALVVMLMYLITGFFIWPVFALGGGLAYIKSGLFGFILGYIFAVIPTGKILEKKYNLKSIILASLIGVICIHLCGMLYCVILALLKVVSFSYVSSAIHSLGGIKTLYDIMASFIFLIIAIPVKMVLWIAMKGPANRKASKTKAA